MQLILDFPVESRFNFSNFVPCAGNETALKFANRLCSPDVDENLLYLYGPSGSGKTHLLNACASAIKPGKDLPIFSFKETPGIAPAAIGSILKRRFDGSPALLIDDIHLAPPDQSLKIQIWQMFNDYNDIALPVVITGLNSPKELSNLDNHLISRLMWGLAAHVDVSDDDSRRMIIKKLATDHQIIIPDDAIELLLRQVPRDIPTLVEILGVIVNHALSTGRKVSSRMLSELHSKGWMSS